MFNIYFLLFYEYLKIGLFAIGGGHATVPFLYSLTKTYNWFTPEELTNLIALSNITPGPVGVNMATYSGFKTAGIQGSIVSTIAIITAPFIVTIITIFFLNKFRQSKIISYVFTSLKSVSCALLTYVIINFVHQNVVNMKAFILLIILFIIYKFVKKYPSLIIITGAFLGIIFNAF